MAIQSASQLSLIYTVCVSCPGSRYEIMYSCWRVDPLDRPPFPQLLERLEKLAEKLPESSSKDDIIYINTSFPEEEHDPELLGVEEEDPHPGSSHPGLHGGACGRARGSPPPACAHRARPSGHSVVTADVHGCSADRWDGCNRDDDRDNGARDDHDDDDGDRYVVVISPAVTNATRSAPSADLAVETPLLPRDGLARTAANGSAATERAGVDHGSCDTSSLL